MTRLKSISNEGSPNYTDWRTLVDYFYKGNEQAKEILMEHSSTVADLALKINVEKQFCLRSDDIISAAMLHDIGMIRTHAPGICCNGEEPYIKHGVLGADMLRKANAPEWLARIAERHTGSGLTAEEIRLANLPLPRDRILYPETLLEKLICYADNFFSKKPGSLKIQKPIEKVIREMKAHGEEPLKRFMALHSLFD